MIFAIRRSMVARMDDLSTGERLFLYAQRWLSRRTIPPRLMGSRHRGCPSTCLIESVFANPGRTFPSETLGARHAISYPTDRQLLLHLRRNKGDYHEYSHTVAHPGD